MTEEATPPGGMPRPGNLKHGDRVDWTAGPTRDVERQQHEHELVSSFLGARLGDRLEPRVIEQCHAEIVKHAVHRPWEPAGAHTGVHQVPPEQRDVVVADELGTARMEPGATAIAALG